MAEHERHGRMRLDEALVIAGLAQSRARARDMVRRGVVSVDGQLADKPARGVAADARIAVTDPLFGYVSRSALKLLAGLDAFGFSPQGLTVLDLGASTGGFTQVLLERGAQTVMAVDVGHGQLHPSLAANEKVISLEGLNARSLTEANLGGRKVGAIVADLSFISLRLALPSALALAEPAAWGVFLVKPQFEVGRELIGKGGIVRDPSVSASALQETADWLCNQQGWRIVGQIPSPIEGSDGNREFLLGACRD
jgi:23S rRNA (cytidine1920-2'-O)/16S rRNA (cytidine1409-2'-O)-methyltransferase